MQEKVVFKLDVFDEKIKRRAMKVVCEFPGVTLIDVKEKGKLKVSGEFDKFQMTKKLKKIYEYVDIIALERDGEPKQKSDPAKKPELNPLSKKKKKPELNPVSKREKKPEPLVKKAPSFRLWKIGFF
ncbi:Copper transport protein family [Raphanus sativus]|uniref:Heavy metal-associated isoprenylated plant protein 10 n=1 Tax=Raphanus sativus TaxID=3726 RepID=A0A6J0MS46_RAPSA|nr:heavy metal-associated isoprenylated plant protein 10 [Raphanus sativus]KAJ4870394.1 Copper transport protein family [Raphanus sativus]